MRAIHSGTLWGRGLKGPRRKESGIPAPRPRDPCPNSANGENSGLKDRGLAHRKSHGPWAARRLADCQFAKDSGGMAPHETWDWAAQSFELKAPGPLVRISSPEAPMRTGTIAPIMGSKHDSAMHDEFPSGVRTSLTSDNSAARAPPNSSVIKREAAAKPPRPRLPPLTLLKAGTRRWPNRSLPHLRPRRNLHRPSRSRSPFMKVCPCHTVRAACNPLHMLPR